VAKLTTAQKQNNFWQNLSDWYAASKKPGGDGVGGATAKAGYTAPAAAAPPPTPYDPYATPYFQGAWGIANADYANKVTHLQDNENTAALGIGANLTRDSNNRVTGANIDYSTIDTTNPFSKAALLQRNYMQQKEGTTNSYANQGQLYSGALLNQRSNQQFGFEQGQDSLQKQLQQILLGSNQARDDAAVARNAAGTAAFIGSLDRAPQP